MAISSSMITFIDTTDTQKVDVHISSNYPITQIYDANTGKFTPNWEASGGALNLTATVYADSTDVSDSNLFSTTYQWFKDEVKGDPLFETRSIVVNDNVLDTSETGMVTYICKVTYGGETYENSITFSLVKTGVNGTSAPIVRAQYSIDGTDGTWESALDSSVHKYIHFSYDGGLSWTAPIKIVGDDGQSVSLKGTAYTTDDLVAGRVVTLYSDETSNNIIQGEESGDSYLVEGYLCVYNGSNFICAGQLQGPKGKDGDTYYLYVRYASSTNGSDFSDTPGNRKYVGFYRSTITPLPSNIDKSSATWNWAKFVGEDAKSITLTANSQVFKVDKNGTISQDTIQITAQAINTTIGSWSYNTDGGTQFTSTKPSGVSDPSNGVITITGTNMTSDVIAIKVVSSDNKYSDILTVYKVVDGSDGETGDKGDDAPIVFLTNENISFAANSNGQVSSTTMYCNVVAYIGTTEVSPTIGPITSTIGTSTSTELPSGMSIETSTISNQKQLIIKIADGATLGSTQNINGVLTIPVTSPISTNLQLTWSKINSGVKGDAGISISSVTVTYGTSTSASTQPTSWQSTIPTVAEGSYLWTRTVTDYTDSSIADTVTYTYAKQGAKGATGSPGSPVTVSKIEYQAGTSATTAPTGTWSDSVVAVSEGGYLWTKTTFSDGKIAYGVARQGIDGAKGDTGATGKGIRSIVEEYYQSTSATAQSGGTWSTTVPTWIDGKYIWTRSVITYTDSTSFTTSPVCITGQKGATGGIGPSGIGISSVDVWYYQSSSATSLSGGSWTTTAPTWVDGKYIWTKTITTYSNNTTDETNAVCITGQKGSTGVGVKSVTEYYLATSSSSGVAINTSGWTTTTQTITVDKKYLWNYEVITYTDNTTSSTPPIIIGVYGNTGNTGATGATGKGIKSVTEYYLATASSSGVTTSTTGWTTTIQSLTATNKYLWNYELITYTDDTSTTISPVIIGVYGDKGNTGDKGADAYTVILTNESHIFAGNISSAIAANATTQVLAYKGSTAQSVTIVSVDNKTASTSSTATSIAGLSFACSALSGTSPTITFTCTTSFVSPSGTIPIVLKVDGVTITKMFTYSIAFKGATGAQGSTGTAASLVDITPSALYFKSTTGKDGTFTPDYIYLYPRFQTVTYSKWEYSVNGGTTWVAASGANGLTISTYNSIANSLRIARSSTLYTDTVTSISFRCVSSNASVYDTVSVAKIYDVVDLQIGGRNLLTNSGYMTNLNGWTVYSNTYPVNDLKLEANDIYGSVLTATGTATNSRIRVGQYIPYLQKANRTLTFSMVYQASVDSTLVTAGGKYSESDNSGEYSSFTGTNIKRTDLGNGFTYMETTFNLTYTEATRSFFVYIYPGVQTTKIVYCKLEDGNKATAGWSSAPEDLKTFQLYAPKGYLITKDVPEVTLQTFAYEGSIAITNATFKWYSRSGDNWTVISSATSDSLVVNKLDVLKSNVYKCEMTYRGIKYEATATVEDRTDIYESVMCISSNMRGNNCYWVLYTLIYTDAEEVDPLLGPISISAPASPASGDYWYAIDETNASVQLKKYNGTSWSNSTDTQSLSYYWDIINNGSEKVPFGDHSKVQVVSCNDFTATATLVCGVNNVEDGLLTQSSLSLTDASDPIVSTTEPTSVIDGQIWIKPNDNGTYIMSVWDAANDIWVVGDMDTRTKVHTSKPSSYSVGDLWITASDTEHSGYLEGTLLMANTSSSTFSESHWSTTLKYDKDLDSIKETLNDLSQYVNITSEGLKISAQSASGEISPFTSLFTSTELAFYQNSDKLLTLANNQLTAPHIVVEDELEVGKTISLGNLNLTIETNGSFSFTVTK